VSIDYLNVTGLSDHIGNIVKITDLAGNVLWSALKVITGTLILRPSADISVEHFLYPANSDVPAYQRINEEVSDGSSIYICSDFVRDNDYPTSKFKLSDTTQFSGKLLAITGVSIKGDPTGEGRNEFKLEVDGIETESFLTDEPTKDFSVSVPTAVDLINKYIAIHGVLPDINIIITSYVVTDDKGDSDSGVSQLYVVLTYEGYERM
jgi:hypothetical protein